MVSFWMIAGVLALAAAGLVTWPLWRMRNGPQKPGATPWALLFLIPASATVMYSALTTWDWQQPIVRSGERQAELPPIDEMTQALADRLASEPDDPAGWQLLGRSYVALGNYPAAAQAYREAWNRVDAPDNALKLSLAEAETLADQQSLLGEAGQLIEAVLAEEPQNPRALWYGGLAAALAQRNEVAKDRWRLLLTLSPPEAVARALRERLVALGDTQAITMTAAAGAPNPNSSNSNAPAASGGEGVFRISVRVAEGLSVDALPPGTQLFILARNPQGGPPLAVVREAPRLPGVFNLSDANAMLPGSSLVSFDQLKFIARLSRSGQPIAQPGDLFGEVIYPKGGDMNIELVIDQTVK